MPLNSTSKTRLEEVARPAWVLGADGEPAGVLGNPLHVTSDGDAGLTDAELRASPLEVELVDSAGTSLKTLDEKLRVSSMPYLYDIAEGHVPDHVSWGKIGFNGDIGTTEEDIWTVGGSYVWPAGPQRMEVVSSSANDAAAGTGVRTVIVYYLNGSYGEQSEVVTLNGVTAVPTAATDIYRIQGFRAVTTGTGLAAAGNIDIRNLADTPVYSRIAQGYTRARNVTWTVPAGKELHVTSITFSVYGATKGIRFTTRANYDADAAALRDFFLPYTEVSMGNGAFHRPLEIPTTFPAQTRIKVSGIADAAGAVCTVALRGWVETA